MSRLSFLHPQFAKPERSKITRTDLVLARFDTSRTRFFLITFIVALGILYILLVNSSATIGFHIADLERQVATLDQEYKQLLVAKTKAESLAELDKHVETTGLVPITNREYIESTTNVLALLEQE